MTRYLEPSEFGRCRPLWEEAFPEDSKEFADYYFGEKLPGSRVVAREDEEGRLLSMAHLNPYNVMIQGTEHRLDYLVGVATRADSRHRGHMAAILQRILEDKARTGEPFCYLMPASPAIYDPFGFAYIYDQPLWEAEERTFVGLTRRELSLADGRSDARLAAWMNEWLSHRFSVYARRDAAYVALLRDELASEAGTLAEWVDASGMTRVLQAVWGREKREQRFLYCDESRPCALSGARPAIMARITDLAAALRPLRLTGDCLYDSLEVPLIVTDDQLASNAGLWNWHLEAEGSVLERTGSLEEFEGREPLTIDIRELTSWIFGYRSLQNAPSWAGLVRPLAGVFLDEVV